MGFSSSYSGPGNNAGWNGGTGNNSNQWGGSGGTQSQPGDPMAAYRQAASGFFANTPGSAYYNPSGGGSGGGGAPSSAGSYSSVQNLLNQQMNLNNQAAQKNQSEWNTGVGMLTGARDSYNNSPLTQQTNGLVNGLLQDPYSINATAQNNMMNQAAMGINSNVNQQQRNISGMLAASGKSDPASMAALQERLKQQQGGQMAQTQTQIGIQKALQDKTDLQNAAHLGQQQNAQNFGVNFSTAQEYLNSMPQNKPNDLSGYIGALGRSGGGAPSQTYGMMPSGNRPGGTNTAIGMGTSPGLAQTPSPTTTFGAYTGAPQYNWNENSGYGGGYGGLIGNQGQDAGNYGPGGYGPGGSESLVGAAPGYRTR